MWLFAIDEVLALLVSTTSAGSLLLVVGDADDKSSQ
jgi:hypothetical protein